WSSGKSSTIPRFGHNATPSAKNASRQNSNGKPSNSATKWCQSNKTPPRKGPNSKGQRGSSSKGEIGLAHLLNQIANRSCEAWSSRTAMRFAGPIAGKCPSMPAHHSVRLQDAQPAPPARPETGQANPQQAVRLPKAETTWRALLPDG